MNYLHTTLVASVGMKGTINATFKIITKTATKYTSIEDITNDVNNFIGYECVSPLVGEDLFGFDDWYGSSVKSAIYNGEASITSEKISLGNVLVTENDGTKNTVIPVVDFLHMDEVTTAIPRISVDLATAFPDKWAALTPGEHTIQIRAKNPGNYLDSDLSTAITFVKVVNWTINITATNCTADASNPTVVPSNTTAENPVILKFNKATGYTLPTSVVLDGIADDGYTWAVSSDGAVGTITIIAPTGNITGTITGVVETTTTIDGGIYKWLDNASLTEWTQEINFTSNGASYSGMRYTGNGTAMTLQYMDADGEWQTVYNYDEDASTGSWVNTAWQIVDLGTSAQTVTAIFKADFIANTTSAYDYTFNETTGVLTLNNAPHSQSGDTLTIL